MQLLPLHCLSVFQQICLHLPLLHTTTSKLPKTAGCVLLCPALLHWVGRADRLVTCRNLFAATSLIKPVSCYLAQLLTYPVLQAQGNTAAAAGQPILDPGAASHAPQGAFETH